MVSRVFQRRDLLSTTSFLLQMLFLEACCTILAIMATGTWIVVVSQAYVFASTKSHGHFDAQPHFDITFSMQHDLLFSPPWPSSLSESNSSGSKGIPAFWCRYLVFQCARRCFRYLPDPNRKAMMVCALPSSNTNRHINGLHEDALDEPPARVVWRTREDCPSNDCGTFCRGKEHFFFSIR